MIEFLIKSAISMVVLLLVYKLFLEKEKMHRFNRFYLLFSLLFSFSLPFINIPVYVEAESMEAIPAKINEPANLQHQKSENNISEIVWQDNSNDTKDTITETSYLPMILVSIYCFVTLLLALRFVRNIIRFIYLANKYETINYQEAKLLLLPYKTLPHTFLNFIFINEDEYRAQTIVNDLYVHELAHVKQKHTLDILFIEVLKTLLWFNPLLYFYKRAIQLNHEFLADEAVVSKENVTTYQNILLQVASGSHCTVLASNLNFSVTKKRFIMMTKTTPKWKIAVLKISMVPFITSILLLMCLKSVAQETTPAPNRIEMETVTKEELDSLQKADPVKYRGKQENILKTTVSYADKKDKHKDTVSFERKPVPVYEDHQFSAISKIDNDKVKGIEILQLTEFEKNTLKELDPKKYNDSTFNDYMAVKVTYINEHGMPEAVTSFEKKPTYQ